MDRAEQYQRAVALVEYELGELMESKSAPFHAAKLEGMLDAIGAMGFDYVGVRNAARKRIGDRQREEAERLEVAKLLEDRS